MGRMMSKCRLFIANSMIFLAALVPTLRFIINLFRFKKAQAVKFNNLYDQNRDTAYILKLRNKKDKGLPVLPITDWSTYEKYIRQIMEGQKDVLTKEPVILLEPTSGTTSYTKYIPYTRGLQMEFNQAIQPWLAGLYLNWPSLLFASQYWSISPASHSKKLSDTTIPIGFETDSQYLGAGRSKIMNQILTVPQWVCNISEQEKWSYTTIFYLVRDKNLGMISVWHPSFLTILLEKIKIGFSELLIDIAAGRISAETGLAVPPLPQRARELAMLNVSDDDFFEKVWPRLKVISCWADNENEESLVALKNAFPSTFFQPKGIIATEGMISFPFGRTFGLAAYRSHLLEFVDTKDNQLKRLDQLELHGEYEPVISTAGGLYRYRMNDLVKVTGFYKDKLPQLKFMCKKDFVADIRGEKVHLQHVLKIQAMVSKKWDSINYFMMAPTISGEKAFYCCYIFSDKNAKLRCEELLTLVDMLLSKNFHYEYARQLGQLEEPRVYILENNPVEDIINHIESSGIKRGDIKLMPLSTFNNWDKILKGKYCH